MLASNVHLLVRVLVADSPGRTFGFARLRLGRVGEGDFQVAGEIRETEYVSIQDQLLGYITIKFKVRRVLLRIISERSLRRMAFVRATHAGGRNLGRAGTRGQPGMRHHQLLRYDTTY